MTSVCLVMLYPNFFSFFIITATDNLNGSVKTVFPNSTTQICVVHQIRSSGKYVVWKDKKDFSKDMKEIYNAPTKESPNRFL